MMTQCWDEDPSNRPSFGDLVLQLSCTLLEKKKKNKREKNKNGDVQNKEK